MSCGPILKFKGLIEKATARNLEKFAGWKVPSTPYSALYFSDKYAGLFREEYPEVYSSYLSHANSVLDSAPRFSLGDFRQSLKSSLTSRRATEGNSLAPFGGREVIGVDFEPLGEREQAGVR